MPQLVVRPLIVIILVAAILALRVSSSLPADQVVQSIPRLQLFEQSQTHCKLLILSNPEIGSAIANLISRSGQTLGHLCECASVYAVSQTPESDTKAILSKDAALVEKFSRDLQKGWSMCLK
jgi:hypothetical protein